MSYIYGNDILKEKLNLYIQNNRTEAIVLLFGLLFFSFYFFLSIRFYQERILSFDSAALAFELIQTKSFSTPLGRYGYILAQVFPLIGIYFKASLDTVLRLCSFNYAFLNLVWFLVIVFGFKQARLGLILLLSISLSYFETFYFTGAIFSMGLPIVIVFYGFVKRYFTASKPNYWKWIFGLLMIVILSMFHELLILPIIFVLVLLHFEYKEKANSKTAILLLFSICWFGIGLMLKSETSYQKEAIPGLAEFLSLLPSITNLSSYKYFATFFKQELIHLGVLFVALLCWLYLKKQKGKAIWYLSFTVFYGVLVIISQAYNNAPNMHQQYYIVFGFIVAFLIFELKGEGRIKKIQFSLIGLLLLIALVSLYRGHEVPSKRLRYLSGITQNGYTYKNDKFVIHLEDFPWEYAWVKWGLPIETLLYSSLEGPERTVTFYAPQEDEEVNYTPSKGMLLGPSWLSGNFNLNKLDTIYFGLNRNDNTYSQLNYLSKSFYECYEMITSDKIWMDEVEIKASVNKVSVKEQLYNDTKYLHEQTKYRRMFGEEKRLYGHIMNIRSDRDWMQKIKEKAAAKKISVDEMLKQDALYLIEQEEELKRIEREKAVKVTNLINYIRDNPKWLSEIEQKAAEEGISTEQMIIKDAKYMVELEYQDKK